MKKITVLLLVLLVACCSVFAFSGMGDALSGSSKESKAAEPAQKESAEIFSSLKPEQISNPVSPVLTDLNEAKNLNKKDLKAHRENLEAVAKDVDGLIKELERIHPFANSGLQVKFVGGKPVFAGAIGGGVKFGCGVTVSVAGAYDFLTLDEGFKWDVKPSWDKVSANLMVGYEF